jgi:hypothetical protein
MRHPIHYLKPLRWAATFVVILGVLSITSNQATTNSITVGDPGYGSSINDLSAAVKAIGATACTLIVPQGAVCAGGGGDHSADLHSAYREWSHHHRC